MATYGDAIYVIDEATLDVTDQIAMKTGIPVTLQLSANHERLYAIEAQYENIEVIDLATKESVETINLGRGRSKVRIWSMTVDPQERYMLLNTRRFTKLTDRWEIDEALLLKYDLVQGAVTDTIAWPDGEERNRRASLQFSPDGDLLYVFGDDVMVMETEGFTEVDRWELSRPVEDGLGAFNFGFPQSPHDDPGIRTGLFNFTDPVQNRRMMGIARVNLAEKNFDFYTLGPREGVGFTLAPGGQKAYGLLQEIGNYEFWTFDIAGRQVEKREPFAGRPRMNLGVSSNGELLYVYNAGATIDVYDADTYELLRTATYDADMQGFIMIPEGTGPGSD
ncbi:MAG: YncE family protein [Longimicrobiales bacterium]